MFDRISVSARACYFLRCSILAFAVLLWGGCGASTVQGTGTTDAVSRAWPKPLVSEWRWERLAPLVEAALREPHDLDAVAASLEWWVNEQGGRGSKRSLHGQVAGSPSYALVEVTEPGRGSRPIRHYVLLFDLPPSVALIHAAEAEVFARIKQQRFSDGDAFLHGFTANRVLESAQPRFGGSTLAQLRRGWILAQLEREPSPHVSVGVSPASLAPREEAAPIGERMESAAEQWGRFWIERGVPMRDARSLSHFDAVLHLFAAEREVSSGARDDILIASLAVDHAPWVVAAGAWLGELVRSKCGDVNWVEGDELLSDFPALVSQTGFKARPVSYVRGRLSGDDLRSAQEYFSASGDGCGRL